MKKKTRKIAIFVLTILLICSSIHVKVFATADSDLKKQLEGWRNLVEREGQNREGGDWTSFNDLAGILWGIGIFIVLICGTILGIKYMFASLEERANIKESMKPYIIGTVIIIGALSIWKFLVEFLEAI